MSCVQLVVYSGWVAADPDYRFTPGGTQVANFRMGSNRTYKDKSGEKQKETTWLKIVVWGAQAEYISKYVKKGTQVIVTGRLRPNKNGSPEVFTLKTGEPAASFEITAQNVEILTGGAWEDSSEEEDESPLPY